MDVRTMGAGAVVAMLTWTACAAQVPVPVPTSTAAAQAPEDACDPTSPFCGPELHVEVEAEGDDPQAAALRVRLALSEGGYFPGQEAGDGAGWLEVQGAAPGVWLAEAAWLPGDAVGQAHIRLPFQVDLLACTAGCAVDFSLRGLICRQPGLCREVVRPVHIDLAPAPAASDEAVQLSWH